MGYLLNMFLAGAPEGQGVRVIGGWVSRGMWYDAGLDDAIHQIHKRRYYLGMPGKVVLAGMSVYGKIQKARIEIIDNGPDGTSYIPVLDE